MDIHAYDLVVIKLNEREYTVNFLEQKYKCHCEDLMSWNVQCPKVLGHLMTVKIFIDCKCGIGLTRMYTVYKKLGFISDDLMSENSLFLCFLPSFLVSD